MFQFYDCLRVRLGQRLGGIFYVFELFFGLVNIGGYVLGVFFQVGLLVCLNYFIDRILNQEIVIRLVFWLVVIVDVFFKIYFFCCVLNVWVLKVIIRKFFQTLERIEGCWFLGFVESVGGERCFSKVRELESFAGRKMICYQFLKGLIELSVQ